MIARGLIAFVTLAVCGTTGVARTADLCRSGRAQSPVAITSDSLDTVALPPLRWHLGSVPLRLRNDGHTLRVRTGAGQYLVIGAERYKLTEVHFHTPGGDTLLSEEFPMAAHMLLRDARGRLLAVVLPMRLGDPNALLGVLLAHVPAHPGPDHDVVGASIDLASFVPPPARYYRYMGSLTASPCTEGVPWLVLGTPASVSAVQLEQWKQHFADNIRGPQPLHRRRVQQGPS